MEVETIKTTRLTLHAAEWLQAKVRDRGLGLRSRLYVCSVCYDSTAEVAVVALYINEPDLSLPELCVPVLFLPSHGSYRSWTSWEKSQNM